MEATMSRGVISWLRWSAPACFILMAACAGSAPEPMPLDAYHVDFATDSYAIDGTGQQAIDAAAEAAAAKSGAKVTIVGRTDPSGSAAYNMQLSQKRAASVHDALIATGKVAPDQLEKTWAAEQQAPSTISTAPPPGDKVVDIYVH
jgi:cation diffusion facilitator CzcD-associated flavoprotein CzcO